LLAVIVWLGLRALEVVGLRFGDLRRRGGYNIIVVRGKGGHINEARVPPNLVEAICFYRRLLIESGIDRRPDDPIFFGLSRFRTSRRVMTPSYRSRRASYLESPIGTWPTSDAMVVYGIPSVTQNNVILIYQAAHDPIIDQRHARHRR
jgi:hypothetical protein